MDIIKTLGPNKVTMSIRANSFDESTAFSVAVSNAAQNAYHLLDPLAVMRSMKRDGVSYSSSSTKAPIMSSYSSMLYAVLCHIDPLVSLLGPDDIKKKVRFFQEQIKNSQLLTPTIRNKVKLDDEEATLHLLSRVLKKNIMVMVGAAAQLHYVNDEGEVILLNFNMVDKIYTLDTDVRMTVKDCIMQCTTGYERMLVKDLKRVAKMIGATGTGTTKSDLVNAIKSKIDSYI
jgi:hypothetical protein